MLTYDTKIKVRLGSRLLDLSFRDLDERKYRDGDPITVIYNPFKDQRGELILEKYNRELAYTVILKDGVSEFYEQEHRLDATRSTVMFLYDEGEGVSVPIDIYSLRKGMRVESDNGYHEVLKVFRDNQNFVKKRKKFGMHIMLPEAGKYMISNGLMIGDYKMEKEIEKCKLLSATKTSLRKIFRD